MHQQQNKHTFNSNDTIVNMCNILTLLSIFFILFSMEKTQAAPVSQHKALDAGQHWLKLSGQIPFSSKLNQGELKSKVFKLQDGTPLFYILSLKDSGFIILSTDDNIEPIIAFSSNGKYDDNPNTPMNYLLKHDLQARLNAIKKIRNNANHIAFSSNKSAKSKNKWELLLNAKSIELLSSKNSINDIRVTPFVKSKWGQTTTADGLACYNYHTPTSFDKWETGNPFNYPSGCVATAMAQVMYYFEYPTTSLGSKSYDILIDGQATTARLLGGDNSGGPYNWNEMVPDPENNITTTQREAIGALMHDCGISVKMQYNPTWSGAPTTVAAKAFKETFFYKNAKRAYDNAVDILPDFDAMINPNLDAKRPVILGITGDGGHAIVSDGYGYNFATMYHHLIMGWDGDDDAWYALPDISTFHSDFDTVYKCIYNISPYEKGEIISGRVTNSSGTPLKAVTILAKNTKYTFKAKSDENGIFAFKGLESDTEYTINCGGRIVKNIKTGSSSYTSEGNYSVGNIWGVDFILNEPPKKYQITFITNNIYGSHILGNTNQTITFGESTSPVTAIAPTEGNFIKWTGPKDFNESFLNPLIIENISSDMEITAMFSLKAYTRGSAIPIYARDVFLLDSFEFSNPTKATACYRGHSFGLKNIKVPLPSRHTLYLWKKKLNLYNKKELNNSKSYFNYISSNGFPDPASLQLYIKTKNSQNYKITTYVENINIVPPLISYHSEKASLNGEIIIEGSYFGNPAPKIILENINSSKKFSLKNSKIYKFKNFKNQPACMDYISGESYLKLFIPTKIETGTYYIILDNKIGIAPDSKTQFLPLISIE